MLDDVEASLTTMNTVLQEYDRPALDDADNYRATFGFPVREFYRRVGFEDEEVFLDASRRYLELFPVHVADARPTRGADEALRRIAEEKPDLILMDVVMPGQNGFQLTRTITRDPRYADVPVIMCTSKGQETDKVWGMRQGARDYVVKPVDPGELVQKIRAFG